MGVSGAGGLIDRLSLGGTGPVGITIIIPYVISLTGLTVWGHDRLVGGVLGVEWGLGLVMVPGGGGGR